MRKIIAGNWKMNGNAVMARPLMQSVMAQAKHLPPYIEIVICPPATLLAEVGSRLSGAAVKLGGQDCHAQAEGAYTGDISAGMLKEVGCSYVIVGHSERRIYHQETSADVRAKAIRAIKTGLIPIICIGETDEERASGQAEAVIGRELRGSIPEEAKNSHFLLAYEPVWAIGSGKTPSSADIGQMHAYIKKTASELTGKEPGQVEVLYGGSVKGDNARDIMAIDGVSGVLVGGASVKADEFVKIIKAAV